MNMNDFMEIMKVKDVAWLSGTLALLIVTAVQALSQKHKPWTYILHLLGKALNAEAIESYQKIDERLSNLEVNIDDRFEVMEKRLDKNDYNDDLEKAQAARRRILRFADELRRDVKHSQEYFNNVLDDIHNYTLFCNEHTDFKNEKAVLACKIIEEAYEKCYREDNFL